MYVEVYDLKTQRFVSPMRRLIINQRISSLECNALVVPELVSYSWPLNR